jgi:plastocyanin
MVSSIRQRGLVVRGLTVAALVIVAAGCSNKMKDTVGGGGGGGTTPHATINIVPGAFNKGMMAFSPATTTVSVNGIVRMHNGDSTTHDIEPLTAGHPGAWGVVGGGASSDIMVTTTGTFTYVCAIAGHTMSGTLIVTP